MITKNSNIAIDYLYPNMLTVIEGKYQSENEDYVSIIGNRDKEVRIFKRNIINIWEL